MKKKWIWIIISVISLFIIIYIILINQHTIPTISYNNFLQEIEDENINSVQIEDEEILIVTKKDGKIYTTSNPQKDGFKEFLLLNGIKVESKSSTDITNVLSIMLVLSIFLSVYFYMSKGNAANKQLIKDVHKTDIDKSQIIKFDNVAGNYEAKEMVKDIIDFIKEPEKYEVTGAKMPKGILLYGVPGTGKTLIARAIAGEAGVPFFAMSGSDFVQMYVGVGANRVRKLFKEARKSKKAVIFIDEIDALGKSRGNQTSSANDEREQTLNALLTEMSGFSDSEGIVVIGATNRIDTLDQALLRPGRFDRQIEITLPDKEAREDIITLYLENKPIDDTIDINDIAIKTVMFSGAMLENLINESAIIAANAGHKVISKKHIDKAFYSVIAGKDKKNSYLVSDEEREITAYHEAGHALIAKLLLPKIKIVKVTIIPTTKGMAGYNLNIQEDKMYRKKHEIISNIKVLLAGRAAEELIYGIDNITTGATNDIEKASKELYNYFNAYGMDEENGLFSIRFNNNLDEILYNKCREKMQELYQQTKLILKEHINELEVIVSKLLAKDTLNGEEIDELLKKNILKID